MRLKELPETRFLLGPGIASSRTNCRRTRHRAANLVPPNPKYRSSPPLAEERRKQRGNNFVKRFGTFSLCGNTLVRSRLFDKI